MERLTDIPAYDAHGKFSLDGSKILFHRMVRPKGDGEGARYDFDLYALDLESGEETRLTESDFEESYGSWAPDGESFVFNSDAVSSRSSPTKGGRTLRFSLRVVVAAPATVTPESHLLSA